MDRSQLRLLSVAVEKALQEVGAAHGVALTFKGGTYDPSGGAVLRIQASPIRNGEVVSPEMVAFKSLASLYGFEPTDLGRKFEWSGEEFQISGLKPRTKYPVMAKRLRDGKAYKFSAEAVSLKLKVAKASA